jgi:signal peptidase I
MGRLMIMVFTMLVVVGCSSREYAMPGEAMIPTLEPDEHFTVDLDAYEEAIPSRWDIIVFKSPLMTDKDWAFRVLALPGEEVSLADGGLQVDGEPVMVPSRLAYMSYDEGIHTHTNGLIFPFVVPAGEYFVLGDNLAIAKDSRTWGCVPMADILGKAYEWRDDELLAEHEAESEEG